MIPAEVPDRAVGQRPYGSVLDGKGLDEAISVGSVSDKPQIEVAAMKRPAAFRPALFLLLASLLAAPAALHAQATPPRNEETGREPSMQELGEAMGKVMEQMGQMMGSMAQTMGGSMQRMMDAIQKETGLRGKQDEHIEGKLAFLKAELQITAAQEGAWKSFADAMRKAAAMKPPGPGSGGGTLPERLDDQARLLEGRLAVLQAKKAAIDRLYAQLDSKQKSMADDLIEQIGLV